MGDDAELLVRLRAGDEDAFVALVDRYHAALVRLARTFVTRTEVAEEVVQDTWLGVVRGIGRFEGRASLKTWLFRILVNRARSAGVREHRETPSELAREPSVAPGRFAATGEWSAPPTPWADGVDDRLAAGQIIPRVRACIDDLPEQQRQVMLLRDVEGLPATDVCAVLGISDGHQRVLLHRARARLRRILEADMGKD